MPLLIETSTDPKRSNPATILSRCLQLNLRLLSEEEITKQLSKIFKEEKISFDDESLKIISKSASGSMRDALTISEKVVSYGSGKLKKEDVQTLLGIPSEEKIFTLFLRILMKTILVKIY